MPVARMHAPQMFTQGLQCCVFDLQNGEMKITFRQLYTNHFTKKS